MTDDTISLRRLLEKSSDTDLRRETIGSAAECLMEVAGVGDPLVDQDEARPGVVHQLAKNVAGAGRP
jgi:hypothetical protein